MMASNALRVKCALEGCNNYFECQQRGRVRIYCSPQHKWKARRMEMQKARQERDFVRFQKQKLIALLTTEQKKKAHDWGLLS